MHELYDIQIHIPNIIYTLESYMDYKHDHVWHHLPHG